MSSSLRNLILVTVPVILGACTLFEGEKADMVKRPDAYDQTSHIVHPKDNSNQIAGIAALPPEAVSSTQVTPKEGTASVSYGKP